MNNQKQENLEKAFALLESGNDSENVLAMFPEEKKEIQEIIFLIDSLKKEKEKINAPKEILEKIFREKEFSSAKKGRIFALETFSNLIINNLKSMNQKSKFIIPVLGIFVFLIVGVLAFRFSKNNSEIATKTDQNKISTETKTITTTSTVVGDQEIDSSINSVLNDALSDDELNAELSDINLALSDEEELNQINNLFNDDEL